MPVTHSFVNPIADEPGFLGTKPSDWNADHALEVALSALDALTPAANKLPYFDSGTTAALADLSAFARTILDDADAAAARTTLGLGAAALLAVPITAANGGTGIANGASATLTLPNAATTITGGGALALGGFTLTVPATGTAALLATANAFTTTQMVDMGADAIELRLQAHSSKTTSFLTLENSSSLVLGGFDSLGRVISYGNPAVTSNFFTAGAGNNTLTGGLNVGLGSRALDALTSGQANFGLGEDALTENTQGSFNVAIGQGALNSNTTANGNVAIGRTAMRFSQTGTSNVIIGYLAGVGVTGNSYSENVAIGESAGNGLTSGGKNILIGLNAGKSLTSGASNILIGYRAGEALTTQSNQLYIANTQTTLPLILGDFSTGLLTINSTTTTTNAVKEVLRLQPFVSTASAGSAAGFGTGLSWYAETATDGTYQQQGAINTTWKTATNASRKASMLLYAYDTAARLGIEIEADGSAVKLGFFGATTVVKPTSTTDLRQALIDLGLYTTGGATPLDLNGGAFTTTGNSTLGQITINDAKDIILNTTTGTKIGTATSQKLGIWNAAPIVQPTTAVAAATFVTNTSLIANDSATFDGYTIGQVVKALRNIGLLA